MYMRGNRNVLMIIFFVLFTGSASGQDLNFGGPFTAFSFNKYGASLSVGGGGTFVTVNRFYIGIFGQGTTDAFKRYGLNEHEDMLLKSRQTGFWTGYNHKIHDSGFYVSLYNKVGFGQVYLNNSEQSVNYYDKTIILTPNIEISYRITRFFEVGIAGYYEFHTGISLFNYTSADFNSFGASILFKFKKSD